MKGFRTMNAVSAYPPEIINAKYGKRRPLPYKIPAQLIPLPPPSDALEDATETPYCLTEHDFQVVQGILAKLYGAPSEARYACGITSENMAALGFVEFVRY